MGCEFAQTSEWNHEKSLEWHLLQYEPHKGVKSFVQAINQLYRNNTALYEKNFDGTGFEWIDTSDVKSSILIYMRKGNNPDDKMVIALNMTPVPRHSDKSGDIIEK